jgi:hypothetical protein
MFHHPLRWLRDPLRIVGADGLLGGDAPVNGHLFGQATVQMEDADVRYTLPKIVPWASSGQSGMG